ncbi:MAG TPA: PHP domain-containing protein, partial [Beijerinckiaceae bacterium]|nr:PHP domain-containing protein [Beijerinckiaceae bacterium]
MTSNSAEVGFVHLHVHTSFSLREGALTIAKLAKLALADRMPALAITDTNNLFGALEFSEKIAKEGIQPIIGMKLTVDFADRAAPAGRPGTGAQRASLVLLAQDQDGYTNLMRLASRAYLDPEAGDGPHVSLDRLSAGARGLIALTGGPSGPLDCALLAGLPELAAQRLERLMALFSNRLYVEVQRHGLNEERRVEGGLLDLAFAHSLPLVATNEPYFATAADYEAHDALLCIAEGTLVSVTDRRQLSPDHRFRTRAEMLTLFADL